MNEGFQIETSLSVCQVFQYIKVIPPGFPSRISRVKYMHPYVKIVVYSR